MVVPAFTAIELVPLPVTLRVYAIAAVPAVEYVLAFVSH
jgi:hypothetical protein